MDINVRMCASGEQKSRTQRRYCLCTLCTPKKKSVYIVYGFVYGSVYTKNGLTTLIINITYTMYTIIYRGLQIYMYIRAREIST